MRDYFNSTILESEIMSNMLSNEKGLQESREAQEAKKSKEELRRQMMAGQLAAQQIAQTTSPTEDSGVGNATAKRGRKKSKATTIAERRPKQKSIHFTHEDAIEIEHLKLQLIRAGVPSQDANAENIIYFFFRHCLEHFKDGIPTDEFNNSII